MTEYQIISPQTRAQWFISGAGLIRKNCANWDAKGDLPLPGVKVCLIGMYDQKYDPIAEIAEANWDAYCRKRGYALRTYPGAFHTDPSRPETFGDKVRFSLFYDVRGIFDIVAMLDIDSLFVNMDVAIEDVLEPKPYSHGTAAGGPAPWRKKRFVWTYGESGPMSGLWIARTDLKTEKHLRYAYEYAATNNHVRHGKIEPNGISDQDAMCDLMHVPPFSETFGNCKDANEVGFVHPDSEHPSPWIVTAKGGSFEDKLQMMRELSQKVPA